MDEYNKRTIINIIETHQMERNRLLKIELFKIKNGLVHGKGKSHKKKKRKKQ